MTASIRRRLGDPFLTRGAFFERSVAASAVAGACPLARLPHRTGLGWVSDAKRLIGRSWNEQCVQDDIPTWPFEVLKNEKEKVKVRVEHRGEKKEFFPQEVSTLLKVLSKS